MKVELENEKKEFTPKKITITLESKEEVAELFHRLNINNDAFKEYIKDRKFKHDMYTNHTMPLFNSLYKIVTQEEVEL